jgi:hypothetical protein
MSSHIFDGDRDRDRSFYMGRVWSWRSAILGVAVSPISQSFFPACRPGTMDRPRRCLRSQQIFRADSCHRPKGRAAPATRVALAQADGNLLANMCRSRSKIAMVSRSKWSPRRRRGVRDHTRPGQCGRRGSQAGCQLGPVEGLGTMISSPPEPDQAAVAIAVLVLAIALAPGAVVGVLFGWLS